jgi:hypothetical protein
VNVSTLPSLERHPEPVVDRTTVLAVFPKPAHGAQVPFDSDSVYHRLFSHPLMVEGLVRDFLPAVLVAGLDFSRLQRVNTKFYVGRRYGEWWMAVRTQVYWGLLWQQVIDEKGLKTGARLPPLLLIVLYNSRQLFRLELTGDEDYYDRDTI